MGNFKQNFNFTTNLIIVFILVFGSIVWADTNGVWHRAEDVQAGVFGSDETLPSDFFIFNNTVRFFKLAQFYDNVEINSNLTVNGTINSTKICIGNDCKTAWPTPPICTGNNGLQWNGTTYECKTFAAGCANECITTGQTACAGTGNNYVYTCGEYDSDTCKDWSLTGTLCSYGCNNGACCLNHASSTCYDNNVYWYNSCSARQEIKESCSYGCSGSSCISCTPEASYSCYNDGHVYWYNSCGTIGNRKDYCYSGCTGNSCNIRFSNFGGGVIKDLTTNLYWEQDMGTYLNWTDASKNCDNMNTGGYLDWRLPTREELLNFMLSRFKNSDTESANVYFTNWNTNYYWSNFYSPSFSCGYPCANIISTNSVSATDSYMGTGGELYVVCVRP